MGNTFIPVLVETTTWEPWTWLELREHLKGSKLWALIMKGDIEKLGELLGFKERMKEFVHIVTCARGALALRDEELQTLVLRCLDFVG